MEHGAKHLGAWRRTALDILEHGVRHLGAKRAISGDLGAWSMAYWQFRSILGSIFGAVCSAGTQLLYSKYWIMVLYGRVRHLGAWSQTSWTLEEDSLEPGVRHLGAKRTISGDLAAWSMP